MSMSSSNGVRVDTTPPSRVFAAFSLTAIGPIAVQVQDLAAGFQVRCNAQPVLFCLAPLLRIYASILAFCPFLFLSIVPIPSQTRPRDAHGQPFTTALRAVWNYTDGESGLHHVTWSARVHHDQALGLQPVDAAYVTSAGEGVKTGIRLNDGDRYFLTVHACNGASICLLDNEVGVVLPIFGSD